ncbi:hypothetical protein CsatA_002566 [Cannabis sativa]
MIFDYIEFDLVELDSRYSFSFPSLKTLSISYVGLVDNDVIDKLLLGFPSLDKLQLCKCCLSSHLRDELHINIQHSLSLKVSDIILTNILVEKIGVINLVSLMLIGVSFDKIKHSACKAIRILTLNCCWGMEKLSSFEYFISNLPLLEKLTLCSLLKWKL